MTDPKAPTKAPAAKKAPVGDDAVTLAELCAELKIDPYDARQKLRTACKDKATFPALAKSHKPRGAWEWPKSSLALKEARKVLTE